MFCVCMSTPRSTPHAVRHNPSERVRVRSLDGSSRKKPLEAKVRWGQARAFPGE